MAELYQEYLRRNLLVAKAIGAKENAGVALKRLEMQTRPPQWLVNALRGILERVDPLPADLARWRDTAPDTPDYVRAEMETSARHLTASEERSFTETVRRSPRRVQETIVRPDSCRCPAAPGEACKLTEAECRRRSEMNR